MAIVWIATKCKQWYWISNFHHLSFWRKANILLQWFSPYKFPFFFPRYCAALNFPVPFDQSKNFRRLSSARAFLSNRKLLKKKKNMKETRFIIPRSLSVWRTVLFSRSKKKGITRNKTQCSDHNNNETLVGDATYPTVPIHRSLWNCWYRHPLRPVVANQAVMEGERDREKYNVRMCVKSVFLGFFFRVVSPLHRAGSGSLFRDSLFFKWMSS